MSPQMMSFQEAENALRGLGSVASVAEEDWLPLLRTSRDDLFAVEVGAGVEGALAAFVLDRHATPELEDAFRLQYPNLAASTSLEQHYETLLERGEKSVQGFMHALRGKLFETRLPELLQERFPGFEFALSESATQAGWDVVGTNADGAEMFVQAKARAASAAGQVMARMDADEAPQLFAATKELHEAIVVARPELADRLIETDVSNMELDEEAESALATLAEQLDIDVPDAIGEAIPYIREVVLGVRLVVDVVRNEKALADMPRGDKNRLHGVKAVTLMARFGVSAVMVAAGGAAGGAAGSLFPGAGTAIGGVIGSIGGAVGAGRLNRTLEPRLLELGLDFAGITKDDLFYYQHKQTVDSIGERLLTQRKELEHALLST